MSRGHAAPGLLGAFVTALCFICPGGGLLFAQSVEEKPAVARSSFGEYRIRAEGLYERGSYALAREAYEEAALLELSDEDSHWVSFRIADTAWREWSGQARAPREVFDRARRDLIDLNASLDPKNLVAAELSAEISEALGDSWWVAVAYRNWGEAWNYYIAALDWWAGSKDLTAARERYLRIVWKAAGIVDSGGPIRMCDYGNRLPATILNNALKICVQSEDRSLAHYLIAVNLLCSREQPQQLLRVSQEFESAIALGAGTDWYDDALVRYAQWTARHGRAYYDDQGDLQLEPDFEKAVMLYRRILEEFRKGESRHYESARRAIRQITEPELRLSVSHVYFPGSEARIDLNWRNLEEIQVDLYPIRVTDDVQFSRDIAGPWQWIQSIALEDREPVASFSATKRSEHAHTSLSQSFRMPTGELPAVFVVEARGGGRSARDILLVTDAALVVKNSNTQLLAYFCDSLTGAPVADAEVVVWEHREEGRSGKWNRHQMVTDADGLGHLVLPPVTRNRSFFAGAVSGERQAFALSTGNYGRSSVAWNWKIYAYSDRPAYRPDERAFWKIVARQFDGAVYRVPVDLPLRYQIDDPAGTTVDHGDLRLNAFGSAWGELALSKEMMLGAYRMTFFEGGSGGVVGGATLFRLEEYKLPEFKVSISVGASVPDALPQGYLLGDTVNGTIAADYYYGGSVADAEVELVVYQKPFFHWWRPIREYGWFFPGASRGIVREYPVRGEVIKRESLRLGLTGSVGFSFETPSYAEQDYEYRIEARVTDASRREIVSSQTIRVTDRSYFVYLEPEHRVYQPGDEVEIGIRTMDANNRPIASEGSIRLTRERWKEIWINPRGREISGDQLQELRRREGRRFYFDASSRDYRLKEEAYDVEEIELFPITTDTAGKAVYSFQVPREGFYKVAWLSRDRTGRPIRQDTAIWAAKEGDLEIGYRPGGVSLIVDRDSFRVGEKAPVMVTVPAAGRSVLFTVGAEDIRSYELLRLDGRVKLIHLEIGEEHVPNSFLDAHMIVDSELFFEQREFVVPPFRNYLTIDITSDADGYQPGETGTYQVSVSDDEGNPVTAELSIGLVDEAVYQIQPEFAPDIRQFFFGDRRQYAIRSSSTFSFKPYFKLAPGGAGMGNLKSGPPGIMEEETSFSHGFAAEGIVTLDARAEFDRAQPMERSLAMASSRTMKELPGEPVIVVREDFQSTVFWQPDVTTGSDGKGTVEVTFPDPLTTWKATARGIAHDNRFGVAEHITQTRLPLIASLQAPRFFVVGDELLVSGVYSNNTSQTLTVRPRLSIGPADILHLAGYSDEQGRIVPGHPERIRIPPNGQSRVDWKVDVRLEGEARIRLTGQSDQVADAVEQRYPVYAHGIQKFVGASGKVTGAHLKVTIDLPADRVAEATSFHVRVTPSVAVTMLDALPYLIEYPYGSTEQTVSRFVPSVVALKSLRDLGLDVEDVAARMFGGVEIEYAGDRRIHSAGRHDLSELDRMVEAGVARLKDFQHRSGGWGWWKEGTDDAYMTAYVVWGLTLAKMAGAKVDREMLRRGRGFLEQRLIEQEHKFDLQAWMLHSLASRNRRVPDNRPTRMEADAFLNLMRNRDRLNPYVRALVALTATYFSFDEDAGLLVENLTNGVVRDDRPDRSVLIAPVAGSNPGVVSTAHWGEAGAYFRWSDGGVEATAFALMALLAVDSDHDLVEPVLNWLMRNRRGAQWSNTRDSAICVLALTDYLLATGEMDAVLRYKLRVNGSDMADTSVSLTNVLEVPSDFQIDAEHLRDGANEIEIIRKSGEGPIYFSVYGEFFTNEDPVSAAGNEIFVERDYYRLKPVATLLKGFVEEALRLQDGDRIESGDRVEVILHVEAKNDLEYLLLEDLKPAGFESILVRSSEPLYARELRSGEIGDPDASMTSVPTVEHSDRFTGRRRWIYQEHRDRHVACFIDRLPQGFWEIRYRLRAETPGRVHALPVEARVVYVPEIRANGTELRLRVAP